MAKSFTPVQLLESELKQWEADLKNTEEAILNNPNKGVWGDNTHKECAKDKKYAQMKVNQFRHAISVLKKYT